MIFFAALAVYKLLQVILSLLPREVMPWVKVIAGTVLSFLVTIMLDVSGWDYVLFSLAVATMASSVHTVLRLITYLGDAAAKKSLK